MRILSEYQNLIQRIEELEKQKINKCKLINEVDVNTISDTQVVYCNLCTNLPRNNTNGYLITIKYTDSYLVQKFIRRADKKEYTRFKENGTWTEWQRVGDIEVKTGQEFATLFTRNGKRVYGKEIDCGNLPNATVKNIPTGLIANDVTIRKVEGITSRGYPLPFPTVPSSTQIQVYCFGSYIEIKTGYDYSSQTATVTIYYTKNNE